MIQQNASASQEMASTAEELSSQADILSSTIAFFRTGDLQRGGPKPKKRNGPVSALASAGQSTTTGLEKMQRALKSGGPSIHFNAEVDRATLDDRHFAPYHE